MLFSWPRASKFISDRSPIFYIGMALNIKQTVEATERDKLPVHKAREEWLEERQTVRL
ncbi:hypothetical protein [Flexibacterium corallicola]|uniref:hypothetical protein n=1 Tax=Flexibacterium corallicola TaxID=3037259 RepID=UPI00286F0E4E|nr:hypothetical protein [Pseudovibrio sp. M1P-2-3]